jgi:hypothetical protein
MERVKLAETSPAPDPGTPEIGVEALRAVCVHITQNKGQESSRVLASLVRALYLDGTMFNFGALDSLGPVSRRRAEILIQTRLWDAGAIEEWEAAYELVRDYEFCEPDREPAGLQSVTATGPEAISGTDVPDKYEDWPDDLDRGLEPAAAKRGQVVPLTEKPVANAPARASVSETSGATWLNKKNLMYAAAISLSILGLAAAFVFLA